MTFGERLDFKSGELLWGWGEERGTGSASDCTVGGFCGLSLKMLVVDALVDCALDSRGCITFRVKSSYDDFIFLSTMLWIYFMRSSYLLWEQVEGSSYNM